LCNTLGRVVFGIVADHKLPLPYGLGRDVARNRLWMYNIFLTILSCFSVENQPLNRRYNIPDDDQCLAIREKRMILEVFYASVCGVLTTFSYLCTGFVSLSIYAGLFGFFLASYICLTSVILVDLLGLEKLTNAFGLLLLWQGIGTVFGPPVAGYLADLSNTYTWTFIFCGINLLVGVNILSVTLREDFAFRRR
ncbi:hypothetical protein OESDEN_01610, partial [Oesophagostomum dentatum]